MSSHSGCYDRGVLGLKLVYRCPRTFDELEGTDRVARRCSECQLSVVNFDGLTESERTEYLALAERAEEGVCASFRGDLDEVSSCHEHPEARLPKTKTVAVLGRVTAPEVDRRWEAERLRVLAEAPPGERAEALARLERRVAEARAGMAEILARVRSRG